MEEHFLLKLKESFPAADWDQHQRTYWFYWVYWTRPTRFYCRSDQLISCFWVQMFEKILFVWFWFFWTPGPEDPGCVLVLEISSLTVASGNILI